MNLEPNMSVLVQIIPREVGVGGVWLHAYVPVDELRGMGDCKVSSHSLLDRHVLHRAIVHVAGSQPREKEMPSKLCLLGKGTGRPACTKNNRIFSVLSTVF